MQSTDIHKERWDVNLDTFLASQFDFGSRLLIIIIEGFQTLFSQKLLIEVSFITSLHSIRFSHEIVNSENH